MGVKLRKLHYYYTTLFYTRKDFLHMLNETIIGGFVVVYADSDAQDHVEFFDGLQDANAFAESILKEGYITAKVFKEV